MIPVFNRNLLQALLSNTFPQMWNPAHFIRFSESKDAERSQHFWPIMISSLRSEISPNLGCDTWIKVSSNLLISKQSKSRSRPFAFICQWMNCDLNMLRSRCSSFRLQRRTQGQSKVRMYHRRPASHVTPGNWRNVQIWKVFTSTVLAQCRGGRVEPGGSNRETWYAGEVSPTWPSLVYSYTHTETQKHTQTETHTQTHIETHTWWNTHATTCYEGELLPT